MNVLVSPVPPGGSSDASLRVKTVPSPLHSRASVKLEQGVVTSHFRRARSIAQAKSQPQLFDPDLLYHEQILSKLKTVDRVDPVTGEWFAPTAQLQNYARCGHERVYRTCVGCDGTEVHAYHCMVKWCPRCNWRIVRRRRDLLKRWMPTIMQPKHIVTTQRNTKTITRRMIQEHTRNLSRLRRAKVFNQVKGGCVSVELTNESKGWHLHAHWLVDARFVDAQELARVWGRLVGQDYAIVKVMDARNKPQYERELMKYVVKGSDLAKWNTAELYDFIAAVRGQRFFFAFGDLFKRARQIRAQMQQDRIPQVCDCGCSHFLFTSDDYYRRKRAKRR